MEIVNFLKNSYEAVVAWFKERKFKNAGWLVAFAALYIAKGFLKVPLLAAVAFVFLGIFIEKNRKSLVDNFKEIKTKVTDAVNN